MSAERVDSFSKRDAENPTLRAVRLTALPMSLNALSMNRQPTILGIHGIGAGACLGARSGYAHATSCGTAGNYATSGGPTYCISNRANTPASIFGPFGTAT